jgi:hypothetical protein
VFEGRVLREIYGAYSEEVIEDWRKLHKNELYDLYGSPYYILVIKSRRMRWAGHERNKKCIQDFCGKHQEKKTLCRVTLIIYVKGMRQDGVGWIYLARLGTSSWPLWKW